MMTYILWYFMITAGFVGCAVVAAWTWFRFPERTAQDVVDFLLPVDMEKVEALLDPVAEGTLRRQLDPRRVPPITAQAHPFVPVIRKENGTQRFRAH